MLDQRHILQQRDHNVIVRRRRRRSLRSATTILATSSSSIVSHTIAIESKQSNQYRHRPHINRRQPLRALSK